MLHLLPPAHTYDLSTKSCTLFIFNARALKITMVFLFENKVRNQETLYTIFVVKNHFQKVGLYKMVPSCQMNSENKIGHFQNRSVNI